MNDNRIKFISGKEIRHCRVDADASNGSVEDAERERENADQFPIHKLGPLFCFFLLLIKKVGY